MRNAWKVWPWALTLFSAWVSLPTFAATAVPNSPTADGAQQFLAALTQRISTQARFVDAAGRANYVTGKYTGDVKTVKGGLRKTKETVEALPERFIDKQLTDVRVSRLEAIDAYGRPTACATRITEVAAPSYDEHKSDTADESGTFSFTFKYTNEAYTYEPLTKFMTPAQVIDWSNVKIYRSPEHYISVVARGQGYPTIQVTYFPGDPDLADRIEHAMRFLAMSCQSAGTGS